MFDPAEGPAAATLYVVLYAQVTGFFQGWSQERPRHDVQGSIREA